MKPTNRFVALEAKVVALRAAGAFAAEGVEVDAELGIIRNCAVMTIGPAEGHGFSLDTTSLQQLATLINATANGVKMRFKHPEVDEFGIEKESLGTDVGRLKNARVVGDSVRGDVYLAEWSKSLPVYGDVWSYLICKAKNDPAGFGLSAVIGWNPEPIENSQGEVMGLVARIDACTAVDFVGQGAATPNGLLSKTNQFNPPASAGGSSRKQPLEKGNQMDPELKKKLIALGLPEDATDEQAQAFYDGLTDEQKATLSAKPDAAKSSATPATATMASRTRIITDEGDNELAVEGKRVTQLKQLGDVLNVDKAVVQLAIAHGDTVIDARKRFLKDLAEKCKPTTNIRVGEDRNIVSLRTALPQAMLMKIGTQRIYAFDHQGRVKRDAEGRPVLDRVDDRAHELASLRMRDVFREYLSGLGISDQEMRRWSDAQMAKAFNRRGLYELAPQVAQLAQGVDDFDSVLANVQNKGLRIAYAEMSTTWEQWCGRRTTDDFKTITDAQMSDVPNLVAKDEHGRYRRVQVSDSKETWALAEYGVIIAFTRRAMLNDDLNVFSQIPLKQAAAARRLEETQAYSVLTANAAMNDTVALFHASHSNLEAVTASVGAPSVTTLGAARKMLRVQTGPKGSILNLIPKFLIVPAALETVAEQYTSANYTAAVQTNINPFAGTGRTPLIPIVQPRLDATSTTAWYTAADKTQIDTVKLCFLSSEPEPQLSQNEDFHTDDLELKVRHSVAAAALDHRGMTKNPGA